MNKSLILLCALFAVAILPATAFAEQQTLIDRIVQRAVESESDSLVIVQDGKTVIEREFRADHGPQSMQSITKSICALAIAMLIEDGKIPSFDAPMTTWIPAWENDSRKRTITLRMLLNHTAGFPDSDAAFWKLPDLVAGAIEAPLARDPGTSFEYSSLATSLLQLVIERAAGRSPETFVAERLFRPLGITEFLWKKDSVGHEKTSGGIFLKRGDLVKLGMLLLDEGSYEGKVLLWPATMRELLTKTQPYFDYGLLFWLDTAPGSKLRLWSMIGWGGQYVVVFPAKRLIAVRTKDPYQIEEGKEGEQSFRDFRKLIAGWE